MTSRFAIPPMEACRFDTPPVPSPLFVCWHPEADDCFNVRGDGQTRAQAYGAMLDDLYETVCDALDTEEEAELFHRACVIAAIKAAQR